MKEYVHTDCQCHDNEYIWIIDFIIGGLFRINRKTYLVECILSPMEIYNSCYFEIRKIINWNDYIIMIPSKTSEDWLIFDKKTKGLTRFCPMTTSFYCSDAFRLGEKIICIPSRLNEPIAVVDMSIKKCINVIYQWFPSKDSSGLKGAIWDAINVNGTVFFPIRRLSYIGMTNGVQAKILKMDLEGDSIAAADFCAGKWWVAASDGWNLYCFDESGNLLEKFSSEMQFVCVRLITTNRFIFMLPKRGKSIHVFDIKLGKFKIIAITDQSQKEVNFVPYWNYFYEDKSLILLPYFYPCIIIDIETLQIKCKEITYTPEFVKKYYWEYYKETRLSGGQGFILEDARSSLQDFMKLIEYANIKKE